MISENVFPALIGALVGGAVTILGWLINYYLGRNKDIEIRQREARIRFIQQQIEELYAPVWGLAEQSRIVHEVAVRRLPVRADGLTNRSKFTEQDNEIYKFFNETYYLPVNGQIAEILRKKIYLMHDGTMPESFTAFLQHQILNESLYRLWKEKGVDSSNVPGAAYPPQFREDVKSTLDDLRQQYLIEIALMSKPKKNKRRN